MKPVTGLCAALLSFLLSSVAVAQAPKVYSLTVEPTYPPTQAQQVYKPLLDYLAKATGQRFALKVSGNYHIYWRDLRANTPTDFTFEEAHFADYRADRLGFTPLVRTIEPTRYNLLASDAMAPGGVTGLIGHRVVCMPAPSLGYLLLSELYKNPIAQPDVLSVAANWKDGVEMTFSDETDAAMVPNFVASLYPNLTVVYESREFPGRALSAAPTVPANVRQAVTNAMLKLHLDNSLNDVITELGTAQFVPATRAEYLGNERLLRAVFGYVARPGAAAAAPSPAAAPAPAPKPPVKK